jgi:hypothetical protein
MTTAAPRDSRMELVASTADEECTAVAQEQQFSSALLQKRHGVLVSLERIPTG